MLLISLICGLAVLGGSSVEAITTFEQHRIQQNDGRFFSYQNVDGQFHVGNWTINGVTTGTFGWLDKLGIETALQFIADDRGYRIIKKHNFQRYDKLKEGEQEPLVIEEDPNDPEHAVIANKFHYVTGNSFRMEQKRKTGLIYGKYGFVDALGRMIVVYYTAHKSRGFLATRQIFDPRRGQQFNITDTYNMPLRDVAAEYGLKEYYRSARE